MIPKWLIPDGYRYFVAGGWAVCPALATDMDVWVQTKPDQTLTEGYDAIRRHLTRWEAMGACKLEIPSKIDAYRANPSFDRHSTMLITKITNPMWEHAIHMLVTTQTPEDVISNFDLSICQVAITDEGQVIRGANWTPVTAPIRQLSASTSLTDKRMEKYKARFKVEAARPTMWDRVRGRTPDEFRLSTGY
jgi:hypothetical protein